MCGSHGIVDNFGGTKKRSFSNRSPCSGSSNVGTTISWDLCGEETLTTVWGFLGSHPTCGSNLSGNQSDNLGRCRSFLSVVV